MKAQTYVLLALCSSLLACSEPEQANKITPASIKTFTAIENTAILTITGKITQFNDNNRLRLDRETLLSFSQQQIKTVTLWTAGENVFSGPLVWDVLQAAGHSGTKIFALAINDYEIEIPIEDIEKYPVILALSMNGKALTLNDKGPIWIIYPWTDNPELQKNIFYARSIWQLRKLHIHD